MSTPPAPVPVDPDTALAETVAAAVRGCPGVVELSSGKFGQFVTFRTGRRVAGVRVDETSVDVGVVAALAMTIPALDAELRALLRPLVGSRAVNIRVEDVDTALQHVVTPPASRKALP